MTHLHNLNNSGGAKFACSNPNFAFIVPFKPTAKGEKIMDLNLNVTVMGVREGSRKDGTQYYRADLYLPGVGPFDVGLEPAEYVSLSKIPAGSALVLHCKVAISDRTVTMSTGKTFTVKGLSLNTGKLSIPENARKVA